MYVEGTESGAPRQAEQGHGGHAAHYLGRPFHGRCVSLLSFFSFLISHSMGGMSLYSLFAFLSVILWGVCLYSHFSIRHSVGGMSLYSTFVHVCVCVCVCVCACVPACESCNIGPLYVPSTLSLFCSPVLFIKLFKRILELSERYNSVNLLFFSSSSSPASSSSQYHQHQHHSFPFCSSHS